MNPLNPFLLSFSFLSLGASYFSLRFSVFRFLLETRTTSSFSFRFFHSFSFFFISVGFDDFFSVCVLFFCTMFFFFFMVFVC